MAVFTELGLARASEITTAHGLGPAQRVEPIAAGSVNSNYFAHTETRTFFVRLYEEQESDGVGYEWALLDHFSRSAPSLPLARRIEGPPPGALRVKGRPVAVFERVAGDMLCQQRVSASHMKTLGAALAEAHQATAGFGWRRRSRFEGEPLRARWASLPTTGEIGALRRRVEPWLVPELPTLPEGPIHGDLFRDNVLWADEALVALIDWESAADGPFVKDLSIVLLSWCYRDAFDWECAKALLVGYESVRALTTSEWGSFFVLIRSAAARFAVTRVLDFHLRQDELRASGAVIKDFRRFAARLDALESLGPEGLQERIRS